ncbi:nitrogen regulation protein NR(II) [Chloroflexota bacterium]
MKETSNLLVQERIRELRENTDFLSTLLDSLIGYAIIAADFDGNIIAYNEGARQIYGHASEEVIGKQSIEIFFSKEFIKAGKLQEIIDGLIEKGRFSYEGEKVRGNGESFPAQILFTLTKDKSGKVVGFIEIVEDLTERKKMQEGLIVSDRLASIVELVAGVAHEINNPLTGVIGFSDLLLSRKDLPDDIKEDLNTISSEARRAARIAKNILAFAQKPPAESEAVNIHKLIENILLSRAHQHGSNSIEVNTKFALDLPEVIINSSELQQVFMNIIINAEFFMIEAHKKGIFTIATEWAGPIVKVSFADDGPGIFPGNLSHLFDPFFTTKEIGKGTGLGLSICYGIISEAGGSIYAESQLGKGATFVVELPAATFGVGGTKDENS